MLQRCARVDGKQRVAYARQAVGAFVPELAHHEMVPGQLTLFDFSERKQSNRAATVVHGAPASDSVRAEARTRFRGRRMHLF